MHRLPNLPFDANAAKRRLTKANNRFNGRNVQSCILFDGFSSCAFPMTLSLTAAKDEGAEEKLAARRIHAKHEQRTATRRVTSTAGMYHRITTETAAGKWMRAWARVAYAYSSSSSSISISSNIIDQQQAAAASSSILDLTANSERGLTV
jgi:hypothetical protein